MIDLVDALQRAELMSDDSLLLSEQSYELLVDKINEEDLYPFTIGLVERGIIVKHATATTDASVEDKLVKAAQYKQSPGGIWMPDSMEDEEYDVQDEDIEEVENDDYESYLESSPFVFPNDQQATQPYTGEDIESLRETLENAGLRITPEGTVEMFSANIPGIYTDKLPQGPLPLDIAVKYFDQLLDSSDVEQNKLSGLLDLVTRLSNQTSEIEASIEELDNYNYSAASRSESSQAIAAGLQEVRGLLAEGNWTAAQRVLSDLQGTVDAYTGERDSAYDEKLSVVDALDRLADLQEADPQGYAQAIEGLGGMPLAAKRKAYDLPKNEEDYEGGPDWRTDAEDAGFTLSEGYMYRVLDRVDTIMADEGITGADVGLGLQEAQSMIEAHKTDLVDDVGREYVPQISIYWTDDNTDVAEVEATFRGDQMPVTWEDPPEHKESYDTFDLVNDEDFLDLLASIVAESVEL